MLKNSGLSVSTLKLINEVSRLPFAARFEQHIWLSMQIQAAKHIKTLDRPRTRADSCEKHELWLSEGADFQHNLIFESIASTFRHLERACGLANLVPPILRELASEAAEARQDIYSLNDSKVNRLLKAIERTCYGSKRDELLRLIQKTCELLSLLGDGSLNYISYAGRLPAIDEIPTSDKTACPYKAAWVRAKAARTTLVTSYMGHVLRMARNFIGHGLAYEDLVQEGFIGLIRAADRYDFLAHKKFSGYFSSWVWAHFTRAIVDYGKLVRLPFHFTEKLKRIKKTAAKLKEAGAEYDEAAVQEITLSHLCPIYSLNMTIPFRIAKLERGLADENLLPTDTGSYEDDFQRVNLADLIPSKSNGDVDAELKSQRSYVDKVLGKLSPREERVIRSRFGFGQKGDLTLEQVGEDLNLTRERVRQIERNALERLCHPARRSLLKECAVSDEPDRKDWLTTSLQQFLDGQIIEIDKDRITRYRVNIENTLKELPRRRRYIFRDEHGL